MIDTTAIELHWYNDLTVIVVVVELIVLVKEIKRMKTPLVVNRQEVQSIGILK